MSWEAVRSPPPPGCAGEGVGGAQGGSVGRQAVLRGVCG